MEEEEEDIIFLISLGITSAKAEEVERGILTEVLHLFRFNLAFIAFDSMFFMCTLCLLFVIRWKAWAADYLLFYCANFETLCG